MKWVQCSEWMLNGILYQGFVCRAVERIFHSKHFRTMLLTDVNKLFFFLLCHNIVYHTRNTIDLKQINKLVVSKTRLKIEQIPARYKPILSDLVAFMLVFFRNYRTFHISYQQNGPFKKFKTKKVTLPCFAGEHKGM